LTKIDFPTLKSSLTDLVVGGACFDRNCAISPCRVLQILHIGRVHLAASENFD